VSRRIVNPAKAGGRRAAHVLFELMVLALFLLIIIYQVFIPPVMGMADNGDFERVRRPNGIYRMPTEETEQRFDYLVVKFGMSESRAPMYYFTSTQYFVALARWLNVHFISRDVFDVRVM